MPRIVSFAWTSPALLAGQKTVTRRDWNADYARRWKPGEIALAYDRSPRAHGNLIARIRVLSVTHERDADAPDSDYEAEGFAWLRDHPAALPKTDRQLYRLNVERASFEEWRREGGRSWVIRFEVIEVLGPSAVSSAQPSGQAVLF